MKILIVNDKYGEFGGTEEYINSFANSFAKFGHEIAVIYGKKYPKDFTNNSIVSELCLPILHARNIANAHNLTNELREIKNFIESFKPDIIYVHNILDHRIISSIKEAKRGKVIWYCHDHYFYCLTELKIIDDKPCNFVFSDTCIKNISDGRCLKRYGLPDDIHSLFEERKKLLESASLFDHTIVISEYMKQTLLKNMPFLTKISLVPRQVKIPEKVSRAYDYVLFAGRFVKEKGVHHAIEAMCFVTSKNIKLVIVGSGDESYMKRCAQLALELKKASNVNIEFVGSVPHEKMTHFYSKANVVVMPSIFPEPFGMVAAESLAHAVPVVAYDSGGISSTVINNKTGFLVEYGKIEQLGQKICFLCNNIHENKLMGENGRKLIQANYTAQKHTDKLIDIFES
ncbi:glycosyltransferase family 4 protein [Peptococcaceae bacterium]|nr:glycosyltransferase family 4 protein [Peptococcaceae bacterium]